MQLALALQLARLRVPLKHIPGCYAQLHSTFGWGLSCPLTLQNHLATLVTEGSWDTGLGE